MRYEVFGKEDKGTTEEASVSSRALDQTADHTSGDQRCQPRRARDEAARPGSLARLVRLRCICRRRRARRRSLRRDGITRRLRRRLARDGKDGEREAAV